MAEPGYAYRTGINQPRDTPLFNPQMSLTNWNTLAVLVQYTDQPGGPTQVTFDSLIFGQTYYQGPSLREFYNRASYGNLNIVAITYPSTNGWFNLPHDRNYYTAAGGTYSYGMGTYPNNSQGLCEDVIALIDPVVDFSNYDNNNDGYVDGIIIIHSGQGAEISLNTLDMWSHRWQISPQTRDGVMIADYCVDPEYRYVSGDATVGVFAHEFGHILGLPDLYDYTVPFDSYGLGYWSLMGYGNWNGSLGGVDTLSGSSPAFLDAWSRVKLGFVVPTAVTCYTAWVTIPCVEDSARVYKLWTYGDYTGNEYFLAENRYQTFTDTALAASGLLIYHVDDNQTSNDNQWWPGQPPANHYMVALEQADNLYNLEHGVNGMDYGDVFWQNYNANFGPSTSPNSRDYYGNDTHVGITSITQGYTLFADLDVGNIAAPVTPVHEFPYDLHAYNYAMMDFQWDRTACARKFHFQLSFDPTFSTLLFQDSTLTTDYVYVSLATWGQGDYFWRVRAGNEIGWSSWSWPWQFIFDYTPPYGCVASSPDTAYASSFLVSWTAAYDPPPSLGIKSYNVYCKTGTGGWEPWVYDIDTLSYIYTGAVSGMTYYFEAFAIDSAGNYENWNLAPECSTYVTYESSGYEYVPGDANMYNASWPPAVIGSDVTYLVNYFRGMVTNPACLVDGFYCAADVNGDCNVIGSDVTRLVGYFRGGLSPLAPCTDYPPAWLTPADCPVDPPDGWPNCE